jgi:hypothetical protein
MLLYNDASCRVLPASISPLEAFLACPFFIPTKRLEGSLWPHPSRLPLGAGWQGICGADTAGALPSESELSEHCNLGYARCSRIPAERAADAVRFCVAAANDRVMTVNFVCERHHRPGEHGAIEFEAVSGACTQPHHDAHIQRLAACYAQVQIERRRVPQPSNNTCVAEVE